MSFKLSAFTHYGSLYTNCFFIIISEEEYKRLRAAIASDGAYHEIGFSYDNDVHKAEPVGPKGKKSIYTYLVVLL